MGKQSTCEYRGSTGKQLPSDRKRSRGPLWCLRYCLRITEPFYTKRNYELGKFSGIRLLASQQLAITNSPHLEIFPIHTVFPCKNRYLTRHGFNSHRAKSSLAVCHALKKNTSHSQDRSHSHIPKNNKSAQSYKFTREQSWSADSRMPIIKAKYSAGLFLAPIKSSTIRLGRDEFWSL